ncbi:MAG: MBL fold metallo-hydrolase [bacterium]
MHKFRQSIFLILVVALVAVSEAGKYPPATVEMGLKRVSEHVYYVEGPPGIATDNQGFISNASAIVTNEGIAVVDALGSPSLAQMFREKLKAVSDKPVIKVFVTHYHADHIYGLQLFKEEGATIYAPAGYQEYLESPAAAERLEERQFSLEPWVNESTVLVPPDVVIDENQTIQIGEVELDINYLGNAHSDGDMSVLVKPDQVLISGDLIFEGRVPFTGSADTRHWLALLEKLDNTSLKALVPGHGPVAEHPQQAISLTLNYLRSVRSIMRAAVDELMPFDEAYDAADWSEFSALPAFDAAHRVNAYGVYLSLEQELMNE